MKLMVILLLVAACHAVDIRSSRLKKKAQEDRPEDEEFSEEKSAVEKRDPAISTVSPAITPGIEYADSKESQQDKSPTQQTFSTPVPFVSKVSDFLTGQGPAYQSAIANNLYAPVSAYQPRLAPASYEVSAPVPSNLAYAELSVSLQPSPNGLQYSQKPLPRKNFQQVLLQQPSPYPQSLGPYFPQFQESPINQFQLRVFPGAQPFYQGPVQIPQPVEAAQPIQPRIEYSQQPQTTPQPALREVKAQPAVKIEEKQAPQDIVQPQGAVSFAKFSQVQPSPQPQQEQVQYQPQPTQLPYPQQQQLKPQQLQQQPGYQIQQLQIQQQQVQPQLQYQPQQQLQFQPQQYQFQQPQFQQPQIQSQQLQQYHLLPQFQQQIQQPLQFPQQGRQLQQQIQQPLQFQQQGRQLQQQSQQQLQYSQQLNQPQAPRQGNQISYLRPGPVFLQSQFPQNNEAQGYKRNVALPTFPPVQYFGKYAQSIFRNYQH